MKVVETATPKMTVQDVPVTFYAGADRRYKSTYITLVWVLIPRRRRNWVTE